MLKIGITGGIGSGKTTVCRIFEVLGIPVFYADAEAKRVMENDEILVQGIKETFGEKAYSKAGKLDRGLLADIVFKDENQLSRLNALVHPAVFRAFGTWVDNQRDAPYVIKEAALLFESGSYKLCNYTALVISPVQLKIQRIMKRDTVTKNDVELRMDKQFTDDKKAELADFLIHNDENELLIPQVLNLHSRFLTMTTEND